MNRNRDIPISPKGKPKQSQSKAGDTKATKDKTKKQSSQIEKWSIDSFQQQKHTREQLVYLTKLAESCKDHERMTKFVAELCTHQPLRELSAEERELLGVAFRHMIRERRHCWRLISKKRAEINRQIKKNQEELSGGQTQTLFSKGKNLTALQQVQANAHANLLARKQPGNTVTPLKKRELEQKDQEYREELEKIDSYMEQIEQELIMIVERAIFLIKEVQPQTTSTEGNVFLLKTQADFTRYLTEFQKKNRSAYAANTINLYREATELASKDLSPAHPYMLGLALNHAIFFHEIMKDVVSAYKLAKSAFDVAIDNMDDVKDESYKDTCILIQLMKDNLMLWQNQLPADFTADKEDKNKR